VTIPRRHSTALLLSAIMLLALNLRLCVNALGTVIPQIRHELGLGAGAAGLLLSMPPLVFAFIGIAVPAFAARMGSHALVSGALLAATAGQLLRALVPGTLALFAGTLVSLIGLAVGNVLMPGLIRLHFPTRITTITSVYVTLMTFGATVATGLSIPIEQLTGGTWRTTFTIWAAACAVAVIPWLYLAVGSHGQRQRGRSSSMPLRRLLQSPLAWAMAVTFGIQSAHVYVVLGWLGQVLLDSGISTVKMGALLSMAPAIGIVMALTVPTVLRRERLVFPMLLLFCLCYLIGYLGLIIAPEAGAWVWMFFIGAGGGTFPTVMTLIALRASTADGVIALSAFTQCIGYLIGSLGPLAFGLLHTPGGSWHSSLLLMIALIVPIAIVGYPLAKPKFLEDEVGLLAIVTTAPQQVRLLSD